MNSNGLVCHSRSRIWEIAAACACLLFCTAARGEPQTLPPEFTNSLEMVFRLIPAGSFTAGPPGTDRRAAILETGNPAAGEATAIERPFYMCAHETRVEDYLAFCRATGRPEPRGEHYEYKTSRWVTDHRPIPPSPTPGQLAMPVTCVGFEDAVGFCRWLSAKEGRVYRLPTEIEWEYAARAGTSLPYGELEKFDASRINGFESHHKAPAKAYPPQVVVDAELLTAEKAAGEIDAFHADPNAWGLYHVLGNVQEYVVMTRAAPSNSMPLPCFTVLPGKTNQMLRGGSWLNDDRDCSVFRANYNCSPYANSSMGFRILLEVPGEPGRKGAP